MGIVEALTLRKGGAKVRPVCWRLEDEPRGTFTRWAEYDGDRAVFARVVRHKEGGRERRGPLALWTESEHLGEWEVVA